MKEKAQEYMCSLWIACDFIILLFSKLQASMSSQNYSRHMMASLDMLYKEVK